MRPYAEGPTGGAPNPARQTRCEARPESPAAFLFTAQLQWAAFKKREESDLLMEFHTSLQKRNPAIQEHLFGAVICTRCWEDARRHGSAPSELTDPGRGQPFIHLPPTREGHLSVVLTLRQTQPPPSRSFVLWPTHKWPSDPTGQGQQPEVHVQAHQSTGARPAHK